MRSYLAATGLALAVGLSSPASAQMRGIERVTADPFGNLVIRGASGYKRILVGQGSSAAKLAQAAGPAGPDAPSSDQQGQAAGPYCFSPPILFWGRSYMYGFHEGLIPQLGRVCR